MRRIGRILVVDPSLLDRQRITAALEAVGYEVLQAESPAEVRAQLDTAPPGSICMVITELHFPDGDGADLVHRLRADPAWAKVPLVVVTSQPPREQVIALVTAGVSTIVSKPFSAELLLRRVTESLAECQEADPGAEQVSWNLMEYLRRELKRAARTRSHLVLMVLQLPAQMEEAEVPALVQNLSRHLRESDLVVRIAPREVAVVLPDTETAGAGVVTRRLEGLAQEPIRLGMALYPSEAADAETLLNLARDRAGSTMQPV